MRSRLRGAFMFGHRCTVGVVSTVLMLGCSKTHGDDSWDGDTDTSTGETDSGAAERENRTFVLPEANVNLFEEEPGEADTADTDAAFDCVHPKVVESCDGEWCRIEPGCFLYGSYPTEPCRSKNSEEQVYVTLTRPYEIGRTEVTQAQWGRMGLENPSPTPHCDDCPVSLINWYEALVFCNALSKERGFEPCYDLSLCKGKTGTGCLDYPDCFLFDPFFCEGEVNRYSDVYECPGYRLPTAAEWEYAARAGTTTETYIGDSDADEIDDCAPDPVTDQVAWSCSNTDKAMPVALKLKNGFGLYDMLGNLMEWVVDPYLNRPYGGDESHLVDPYGFTDEITNNRPIKGGMFHLDPSCSRSARNMGYTDVSISTAVGFRPVRTLFDK